MKIKNPFGIIKRHLRKTVQISFTALSNGYVAGFAKGGIYQGKLKKICVPGLNCYSCPGALGSCPIGSLQAVLSSPQHRFSAYMTGFFLVVGALLGRFVCGWLCPFGLLQELLYKIPFFKKRKNLPGHKILKYLKYVILVLFVILLPMLLADALGQGDPWFCKWICPVGTLEGGVFLSLINPGIRSALGPLFLFKGAILVTIILLSLYVYRPFCKYLCPLGGIYGFFNRISAYRLCVDEKKCIHCGICERECPMSVHVPEKPNDMECIRCGKCKQVCPKGAIEMGFFCKGSEKEESGHDK